MAKKVELDDTGERLIPEFHKNNSIWGAVYGEHVVRYEATVQLAKGKIVLDIACGSGYGSALLAKTAKKVIGVDVDKQAVDYAIANYGSKNIEFLVGDATSIPLETDSVDVVVTYETIEHIEDYKKFMQEIKRVLKPDGLAIISTPNDKEFMQGNHFHIHQFELAELKTLIGNYFTEQKPYLQAEWISNIILDKQKISSEWQAPIQTTNLAPKNIERSVYFFILCSNRQITEKVEPLLALSEHWSYRETQDKIKVHEDIQNELKKQVTNLTSKVDSLNLQLNNAQTEIKNIKSSKSWKLAQKIAKVHGLTHPKAKQRSPKTK